MLSYFTAVHNLYSCSSSDILFPSFFRSFCLLFWHLSTDLVCFLPGVDESSIPADDVETAVALAAYKPVGTELVTVEVRDDREGLVERPEGEGEHVD